MTPAARIQAAIDLLGLVAVNPRPADGTIAAYFRERRFIGSKDRRYIGDLVWSCLRHWARAAWAVHVGAEAMWEPGAAPDLDAVTARQRVLADLVLGDRKPLEQLEKLFTGEKYCPKELGARERGLVAAWRSRSYNDPTMPVWVRGEVPEWVLPRLEGLYGSHVPDLLAALREEAPVDLRVNTLKGDLTHAVARLAEDGIQAAPTAWSPLGLRLDGRVNLAESASFKDGLVEVQDEGSQLIAHLVGARPGMAVCDYCAGAGGKTLALAAMMQNKGRLVACDVSAGRIERSGERLKRAGVHNVTRRVLDGEGEKWVKRSAGAFDRVLVDAPCSGTGTWRRNPDAKWRLTAEGLGELTALQARVLRKAARLVRPGGRLVYATCSLLHEENEGQVEAFLGGTADFRILPVSALWPELVGGACPLPEEAPFLRLDPARHGTDGFFVAVLERVV